MNKAKRGYTLAELLIVIGLITILGLVSFAGFVSRRNQSQLESSTLAMVGLLREAQSRAVSQENGVAWGVRFENSDSEQPFFVIFSQPYNASSTSGRYALPAGVAYSTSSIASGNYAEVFFSQASGFASGSSTISIHLIQDAQSSSTVSISSTGAVEY